MKIDPYLSLCTKLNSKWIKDLHIKPDTLDLIEESVGKSFKLIGMGEILKQNSKIKGSKITNQ